MHQFACNHKQEKYDDVQPKQLIIKNYEKKITYSQWEAKTNQAKQLSLLSLGKLTSAAVFKNYKLITR